MTDLPPSAAAGRSPVWWAYFAVLALFGVAGLASLLLEVSRGMPPRVLALAAVATLLNAVGLVGLVGYIRARPLLVRAFWQGALVITVLQLAGATYQYIRVLRLPGGGSERWVVFAGLGGIVLAFPLLWALARYAFGSAVDWPADRR